MRKLLLFLFFVFTLIPKIFCDVSVSNNATLYGNVELGGSLDPTSIPSCTLWLDADDINTLSFNGMNVTQWDDKSYEGHKATQTVAANQPLYVENALNGRNVIRFDNDWLGLGNTRLFEKEHTIFLVGKHGSQDNQWYFSKFKGTLDGEFFLAANYDVGYDFTYVIVNENDNRVDQNANGFPDFVYAVIGAVYDGNYMSLYKNGNFISYAPQTGNIKITPNTLYIGLLSPSTSYYLRGDIAEIIVYERNLNPEELQKIFQYLLLKWGI